ncbi:hypothetical protein MKW98_024422 [Papaver atlanticum]|uniref:Uncharacterized protein n=1 Tax=Papaver atlanticum TaxID=357466 RepID=A0AAD4XP39_9MAGN|nr:hypothetical protein MKW98_024422 [Papaver atlanticum]
MTVCGSSIGRILKLVLIILSGGEILSLEEIFPPCIKTLSRSISLAREKPLNSRTCFKLTSHPQTNRF